MVARVRKFVHGLLRHLVPLAQKRERGRVRGREVAACGDFVPLGGFEGIGLDAGRLGQHGNLPKRKAAPKDG